MFRSANISLIVSTLMLASRVNAVANNDPALAQAFTNCDFKIKVMSPFIQKTSDQFVKYTHDSSSCAIDYMVQGRFRDAHGSWEYTLADNRVTILIYRKRHEFVEEAKDYGFAFLKTGKWQFKGNPVTIGNIRFRNLSTSVLPEERGITLVGRQTEAGFTQKGDPITFKAVNIVRETPDFFVYTNIAFMVGAPIKRCDEITQALVGMVQSVRVKAE
jgi:hypothetical protein